MVFSCVCSRLMPMHASKMVCRVCLHMFRLSQVVVFLSHFSLNKLKWVTLINWFARQKWNSFPFLSRTAQSLRENLHLTVTFYEPYVRWLLYLWHAIVNRKRIYHKKGHKTEFLRMLIDLLYTVWVCGAYQQQIRHYISMEKNKKNNKKHTSNRVGTKGKRKTGVRWIDISMLLLFCLNMWSILDVPDLSIIILSFYRWCVFLLRSTSIWICKVHETDCVSFERKQYICWPIQFCFAFCKQQINRQNARRNIFVSKFVFFFRCMRERWSNSDSPHFVFWNDVDRHLLCDLTTIITNKPTEFSALCLYFLLLVVRIYFIFE